MKNNVRIISYSVISIRLSKIGGGVGIDETIWICQNNFEITPSRYFNFLVKLFWSQFTIQ